MSDGSRESGTFAYKIVCLITPLYLTLCDPMDCSPPDSSVHGDSPSKNTGVDCHALLQGIFPTQGSNPDRLFTIWATSKTLAARLKAAKKLWPNPTDLWDKNYWSASLSLKGVELMSSFDDTLG